MCSHIVQGQSKSSQNSKRSPIFSDGVWGMSWSGASETHFRMPGVKTNTKIYEETILELVVKPLNETLFHRQCWIFQDLAPALKSKQC